MLENDSPGRTTLSKDTDTHQPHNVVREQNVDEKSKRIPTCYCRVLLQLVKYVLRFLREFFIKSYAFTNVSAILLHGVIDQHERPHTIFLNPLCQVPFYFNQNIKPRHLWIGEDRKTWIEWSTVWQWYYTRNFDLQDHNRKKQNSRFKNVMQAWPMLQEHSHIQQ